MKISRYQPWMLAIALGFAGFIAVATTWNWYRQSCRVAEDSVANYHEASRLVSEISRSRNAPRIASLEIEPPDRIAERVTTAAQTAMLSPSSIYSVDPQTPARVGRSPYQLRATQIVLQEATLPQIASFIQELEEPEAGMLVRDLTLNSADAVTPDGLEQWNARLTLTQMIYSPISEL